MSDTAKHDSLAYAIKLTVEVRKMQKRYFKERTREVLIASKKLEAELDKKLKDLGYEI